MPALVAPPLRDQVGTRDKDHFELCGEACLASALGLDVESVVTWLRQHEGGERAVRNGTAAQELIDFCTARGTSSEIVRGPATQYTARATSRGHYCLVLVWSDHFGNPVSRQQSARLHAGGIGHWLLGYGTSGPTVKVMQPWGGRLISYDLRHGQDQRLGIEIERQVAARPTPSRVARPAPTRVYVVKAHDTLTSIARAQGVTLERLIAANPQITNPDLIFPGQRLVVPI
jgi:LysM repeat protein